ncbi:hypothetical protein O6H91_10G076800 [Diphasiastrum complanatum]|uniref:Uncharacterized protein n=1 Tax=Diphasiastrum complanatum TaxID=34168 RepID=A0ACC2CIG2_DIPCM|nr:hypothetical protein O6H91_10G076800 [Diphasiastrum complanatum]
MLQCALQSGQSVEAVIMRHDSSFGKYAGGPRPKNIRATLCVSSQVGCKMGCTFCATGAMGFKGNLSAGEIVEQLVHASCITPIRNIVFMGMGEPLNNYSAVIQAVRTMTGRCFGLSPNHITVSTVGVVPRILSLAHDLPGIRLAVSVHAPTQELRCQIVPAARAFPLGKLVEALNSYQAISKQTILIEYVMLAGINDTTENAHQLGKLLMKHEVVVNLIPYNPTLAMEGYKASTQENVFLFQKLIREVYGLRTTIRKEMGQDIQGACGQLALHQTNIDRPLGTKSRPAPILSDIEDICQMSP